jgi:protocatechuate 3,4-dioxygenase beta subunit
VFDEQGAAREGLRVQAAGLDGRRWGETRTQAGGRYSLPSLPAGRYTLRVLDERGQLLQQADSAEVVAAETRQWVKRDLFLVSSKDSIRPMGIQQTGQITGVVTASGTGLPLADVVVTAYDAATGSSKGSGYTDSNGEYTVDFLATGSYKVEFSPSSSGDSKNYLDQFYNNQTSLDSATPINVTDGQPTPNINAVLQPGGQITGRVTAADTHNPLEDVFVNVSASAGCSYWSGYAYTDANGVYTVTAIPTGNNYKVDFDPTFSSSALTKEYIEQYYNNKPDSSSATPVAVTAPNVVNNIDAALLRGGQIKGLVTGQGSVGLPAVNVTADGAHSGNGSTTTDATGAYTITGLMSDTYKVEFSPSSYGASKDYAYQFYNTKSTGTTADPVAVTAPNVTPNINQVLPLGSRITGRVTTADTSSPMQSASISVYASDGNYVGSASTNASGVYTTSALPTGNYRIQFRPSFSQQITYTRQYYNNKPTLALADVLNVTAPNLVSNINAALARGGQISGTITAADTGLPVQGVSVVIYDSTGSSVDFADSDATGAYLTPALVPGSYRVYFIGGTLCSSKCYASQYYNNKPTLATADVVNVVASLVTKNINATLAVCSTGPTPPSSVSLGGPVTGTAFSNITFNATVSPGSATTPITYTWQATGQSLVKHTGGGTSDTINFIWGMTGTKAITVTATNALGSATNSRTITIDPSTIVFDHWIYLPTVMR